MSPFLFNLVVESMSGCLKRAAELNLLCGFSVGDNEVQVTHLQYVDDTILFLEPNVEYLINSKRILRCLRWRWV